VLPGVIDAGINSPFLSFARFRMYLRHSTFYFWYFSALGVLLPYWGLYLQSRGFGAAEIGELIAIMMATKLLAPIAWGWVADATGRRMLIVRTASLLAMLCFAGVFLGDGFWWLAAVVAAFSFFWNAALPQFEAVTLTRLGDRAHRYGSIRLWGSIGFIIAVIVMGPLLDRHGAGLLPIVLIALYLVIWLSSLAVPDAPAPASTGRPVSFWEILRRRDVIALLLVCLLMQASHGPYYSFFSIHLEAEGYERWLIGQLWALGVLAEIVVFIFMHRLQPRYTPRRLLLVSLALTTVRWPLIAFGADHIVVILLAQMLHAASFGVYHAVAITLIHDLFQRGHQGRGQALYSSISYGAGGAIGSLYAGYAWEMGGAGLAFMLAAAASATAFALALRTIGRPV
jgi:PPP family 3-phenylpropionic acid transporter